MNLEDSNLEVSATERWRTHTSAEGLTWGVRLDGGVIVRAIERHARLAGAAILEIGPGYGRFIRSLVDSSIPFASYAALDISAHWVRELTKEFRGHNDLTFVRGAAQDADALFTGRRFDLIISMLTWKHLYPDFSAVARACRPLLAANGRLIFDLPETNVAWPVPPGNLGGVFEETSTFTRTYTRQDVELLLSEVGLTVVAFDEIEHATGKCRMLAVASRAPHTAAN